MYNSRAMQNKQKPLNVTEYMGINSPELKELVDDLFGKKKYSIKDVESSHESSSQKYRTINHWSQKGLINQHQEDTGKWHKFTFIDLFEMLIYEELRKIGFPLEKLLKVKSYLSEDSNLCIDVLEEEMPLSVLGHKALQVVLGGHVFITVDQGVKTVEFSPYQNLVEQLKSPSGGHDELYQDDNAVVIIDLRKILNGLDITCKQNDDKFTQLMTELFDKHVDKEITIRQNETGELGKVESTHIKDLDKEQNINELVNAPDRKTTIYSDENGAHKVKIQKKLK